MGAFPTAYFRRCAWICLSVGIALTSPQVATLHAQITAFSSQNEHRTGQYVSPVYEGWYKDRDGSIKVVFGYQNLNTEEIVDVPIGPNNKIEPGPADQGQPTHFLTGRQYGLFAVTVPKNALTTELTWTLNVRGHEMSIPANLNPLRANKPMSLTEIRQLVPQPFTRTHIYNLMHRVPTPAGQPALGEQHDGVTDLYIVIAGSGMTTVGGEIPEKKSSNPGEYTGIIKGGETFPLKAGDILEIPPSVPHATSTGPEGMTYMMVKINVGLYPWSIVGMVK